MEKRKRAALVAVAMLMAVLFGWIANAVAAGQARAFDLAVRDGVHAAASPPFTMAMRGVTLLGSIEFLLPLGAFVVWRLLAVGRRRDAVWLVVAALGADGIDTGLKLIFERPRPEAFFGLAEPASWSFPSGHSMASFCFYGAVAAIAMAQAPSGWKRAGLLLAAALVVFTIGFSRVYLGVHYPTDVLGGYAAGMVWLLALWAAGLAPSNRRSGEPPAGDLRPLLHN